MAERGLETRRWQAEMAAVLGVEHVLKIQENSLKNNSVKARADVDGSNTDMWRDLNVQ